MRLSENFSLAIFYSLLWLKPGLSLQNDSTIKSIKFVLIIWHLIFTTIIRRVVGEFLVQSYGMICDSIEYAHAYCCQRRCLAM